MMRAIVQHRSLLPWQSFRRLRCTCIALLGLSGATASAVPLIGTNGNTLVRFDSATPAAVTTVAITGLQPGETLVGIDYRPWTGQLYGVGATSRVYVLDPFTGAATQVGASQFLPTLNGTAFSTDFSPQIDRIRQVSNTEQNLRLDPNNGENAGVDSPLNPAGNVVAVAYDRNDTNVVGTQTTLFGVDSAAGTLVRIGSVNGSPSSANAGPVFTIGSLGLGTNLNEAIGLDIATNGVAYATITTSGVSRLYTINVATGVATLVSPVGNGATPLLSVTAVMAPAATAYGVNASGTLYRFNTAFPGSVTEIGPMGIVPNAIDFRPGTQTLYALDVDNATTRLYTVNTATAAVTPVGPGFPSTTTGPAAYDLTGTTIGMDFNPRTLQADGSLRIRVVARNGSNLRLNSDTGQITAIDTPLAFAAGDPNSGEPFVDAAAYINNAKATGPAFGTTTLYDIDFSKNALLIQNPPNAGTLNTVGSLGIDPDISVAFDILTAGGDDSIAGDFAFAALRRIGDAGYTLYDVDLATGAATNPRTIGGNLTFGPGFAVQPLAPTSTLSINDVSGQEGNSGATVFEFTVTLSPVSDVPVIVQFSTADDTATAAGDYATTTGTITFDPGQATKSITVGVNPDTTVEPDENFFVNLSGASNATIADAQGVGTIVDDDEAPGVAIATSTNFTDNDAPPGATVRVGSTVTFDYVVTNSGNVPLSNVIVTDDNGTPDDATDDFAPGFLNGDANGNSLLDLGETWTYSTTRVAAAGQFSHTGSVTATPQGGGANVVAGDPEHQFGIVPTVLANISTRLRVETGNRVLIGGFIITGNEDKKVIVRALGPSVDVPGALADPMVEVYNSEGGLIAQNDNWKDAPNRQEIVDSTIPPTDDRESAFLGTLAPGDYTAIVSGVGETSGIGLVEVYDLDQTVDSDLGNISTRGFVQTGNDVLIGGLIVAGDAQLKILVRGIGPSLTIAGKLADPTLELVNANGDTLLANDNWRDTQESDIEATTIPPNNDLESAILTTVQPANYTAILRGRDGTIGIGVVEIYAVK